MIENVAIVAAFSYLVSHVANMIEKKYKPPVVGVQEQRLNALYGRDEK